MTTAGLDDPADEGNPRATQPTLTTRDAATLTIGAVLDRLKAEFPDVTISKIRFLESEGLITPSAARRRGTGCSRRPMSNGCATSSRRSGTTLPLEVIKDQLNAIDRGLEPATPAPRLPRSLVLADRPSPQDFAPGAEVRMTRAELLAESELTATSLAELEQFGLVAAGPGELLRRRGGPGGAQRRRAAGRRPRAASPRSFRTAADREAALVTQLVSAQARQRDPDARERAGAQAAQLAATILRLHTQLVRAGLRRDLGR